MNIRTFALIGTALLSACAQSGQSTLPVTSGSNAEQRLRWLDRADPERDLAAALARGDRRFVGTYGYTATVPGAGSPYDPLPKRYGVRFLRGTSDAMTSQEDERLNDLARRYAKKYNQLLLQHLRRGDHAP